ncbi:MAG: molybdopterin converting factor subunit 1 [Dehalococcoidia bacterium]
MPVRVLLFAGLREAAGTRELCVDLDAAAGIVELRAVLARTCPRLAPLLANAAIAVNEEYADDDVRLQPGDTVALIPPVSGG